MADDVTFSDAEVAQARARVEELATTIAAVGYQAEIVDTVEIELPSLSVVVPAALGADGHRILSVSVLPTVDMLDASDIVQFVLELDAEAAWTLADMVSVNRTLLFGAVIFAEERVLLRQTWPVQSGSPVDAVVLDDVLALFLFSADMAVSALGVN